MRISDWSSDVCSSDLERRAGGALLRLLVVEEEEQLVLDQRAAERRAVGGVVLEAREVRDVLVLADHRVVAVQAVARAMELVRSDERRVGKEWVRTCSSRWSPYH